MIDNWWREQKRYNTTLYYMIGTFFFLLSIASCVGLMVIPILLTVFFNYWLWLLMWFVMIPLCVGIFNMLLEFLT